MKKHFEVSICIKEKQHNQALYFLFKKKTFKYGVSEILETEHSMPWDATHSCV